jgi:hypothetical protein
LDIRVEIQPIELTKKEREHNQAEKTEPKTVEKSHREPSPDIRL